MRKTLNGALVILLAAMILPSLPTTASGQSPERYVAVDFATAVAHIADASTNTEIGAVRAGASPTSVVISPNHRLAFVANLNSYYVSVLDLVVGTEIKRIRDVRLAQLAMTADGLTVVGTDVEDDGLTIMDAATLTVKNHISLNGKLGDDPSLEGDLLPDNPVIVGDKVYLNTAWDVGVVNLTTGAITDIASTPASFSGFLTAQTTAATPDGKFVIAIRQGGLLVVNPVSNAPLFTLPVSDSLALSLSATRNSSDPSKIFVYMLIDTGFDRRLSVLDFSLNSPKLFSVVGEAILPASFPTDFLAHLAPDSRGTRVYLTTSGPNRPNVLAVDVSIPSSPALVSQASIGFQLRGIAADLVQGPPTSSLQPVVVAAGVSLLTNDVPNTINISGNNFAPDTQVRVGNLDPIPARFVSPTLLQVTIPQHAAAQVASVIVTNPNRAQSITFQNSSAMLRNPLTIASPPTFQPANQVGVVDFGDSTFSVLNTGTNETPVPSTFAGQRPLGFAVTPDGSRAYIENVNSPGTVSVFNFTTRTVERTIVLDPSCGSPGQTKGIALEPRLGTRTLTAFVVCSRRVSAQEIQELYMIDAEPTSPTFETVVNRVPTGAPPNTFVSGPLAITPDGRFAFICNPGTLIVLDLSSGSHVTLPNSTLGLPLGLNPTLELSPDGKYLVSSSSDFRSLLVFDINVPEAPKQIGTVQGLALHPVFPRVVNNRLIAVDNNTTIDVFNFKPSEANFTELGSFLIPETPSPIGAAFDVTNDGQLLYLPMREEDAVWVLDVDKMIKADPSALLTKVAVGIAPSTAVVRQQDPVILARSLLGSPYLFGGKGFDWHDSQFVDSTALSNGYHFSADDRNLVQSGVDCSGLVFWAYNKAFGASRYQVAPNAVLQNPIHYQGADGQFAYNSAPTANPVPGDMAFFNFANPDGTRVDHEGLYIGGDDVIESPQPGDVVRLFSRKKIEAMPRCQTSPQSRPCFAGFQRRIAPIVSAVWNTGSPVDLAVTDPDGLTITADTRLVTDREILREIPRELYYSVSSIDADGSPNSSVTAPVLKRGDYFIRVFPRVGTLLTATYSLEMDTSNSQLILASNVSIRNIPVQGYGIHSDGKAVVAFIPVSIDIKPGSQENTVSLRSNGKIPVAILSNATFDASSQIDPTSLKFGRTGTESSLAFCHRGEDVNEDGLPDLVCHFNTQEAGFQTGDLRGLLEGFTIDGQSIRGSDSVRVVK